LHISQTEFAAGVAAGQLEVIHSESTFTPKSRKRLARYDVFSLANYPDET
jgi:hypothetical protein